MKILGICGSPRRGNTEWMLSQLMKELEKSGAEAETLRLRKLDIKNCRGCLKCAEGGNQRPGICKIKDDMAEVYPKMLSADVIIFASPSYFYMISGILKNFMDRTCPIWPKLKGKRAAGLAAGEEGIGQTIENLKMYADTCEMQWVDSVTALARDPGDAAQNRELKEQLNQLALKILTVILDENIANK